MVQYGGRPGTVASTMSNSRPCRTRALHSSARNTARSNQTGSD
ncbi:hypothetical protein [Lysobacter gummosus]